MERGLIIKKAWLDRIFDSGKTWEMRSRPTKIRGRIGLIEAGSGLIVGEAMLMGWVKGNSAMLDACNELHQVGDAKLLKKWPYAWVLAKAKRYDKPIPYTHPNGAVAWVSLNAELSETL